MSLRPAARDPKALNRRRNDLLQRIQREAARGFDGHVGLLLVEFHHDADGNATIKSFDRVKHTAADLARG